METPISTGIRSRAAPQSFLKAVRSGMVRRLGADPNFRFGLGKNPLHTYWKTTWLVTKPYSLNDMAVFLDAEDMRQMHKSREEENEFAQLGRNNFITSELGKYGLKTAWRFQDQNASFDAFLRECRAHAFEINNTFGFPLGFREVQTIAKSVAKWAWSESTRAKFSEIQSLRASTRRRRNEALLATVPDLHLKSNAEVQEILGLKARAVRNYHAMPRAEYEAKSISRMKPWEAMGISRRTYYRKKSAGEI